MHRHGEKEIARSEDQPRVLVFADILGFAALTKKYRIRVQDFQRGRFSGSSTTELSNQVNRFYTVLDQSIFNQRFVGSIQAMIFSDCASLVFENSLQAAPFAVELMRNMIKRGVPVRMGIRKGTFYDIEHSTMTDMGGVAINKSRFIGTSVVDAHAAEQCGGKGMRIFLDASVEEDLPLIRSRIKALRLAKPFDGVNWELDYLNESRPIREEQKVETADRELFDKVARMKNPKSPRNVQRQYTQTLTAMNRMRIANSRKRINLRRLQYGGPVDAIWS
jgi:hypothetical protein